MRYRVTVTDRERTRCRQRLAALAGATLDPEEARREAIAALRRAIGFERWCWPLTDPASALAISGIGEVDFWPVLPRMVALEQHGDLTSKPALVRGRRASVSLSAATRGDLARSRRWRECLRPYDIGDELMTACRDGRGCWGTVELLRDRRDAPFAAADVELLHEVAPLLAALLRRALSRSWQTPRRGAPPSLPPATVILDGELRPSRFTPSLRAWLAELPPTGAADALPPAVFELGARALAPGAAHGLPDRVRLRTRSGDWAVLDGAPLAGGDDAGVAITIGAATGGDLVDLLGDLHDLTRRERELVALVLAGLSTKEIARALAISSYTVQDHLKSVFGKTGARSRGALIARFLGTLR